MDKSNNITLKYLFVLFIGTFAFFFIGGAIGGKHQLVMPILSALLIFMLIFMLIYGIGLVIFRNFSTGFILKTFAISFGVLFLIYTGSIGWDAYSPSNVRSIYAYELESAPDEFVVVTQEELNEYPGLKRAIETKNHVEVSAKEFRRTLGFLGQNGIYNIKIGDEYYQIVFSST
ncbi:hypothetical protein [Methanolobus sp.]|jgi:hypothetical protein|uniref:hypothetical protein n=1 Tax=Methanolobus sp. TaxID=1874737 RepID=UPI0025F3C334|nr:hypothetical protein [Methanolobus sp.]